MWDVSNLIKHRALAAAAVDSYLTKGNVHCVVGRQLLGLGRTEPGHEEKSGKFVVFCQLMFHASSSFSITWFSIKIDGHVM